MTVAFLHGFAGDPSVWAPVISELDAATELIALPGHGGGPVLATWEANLATVASAVAGCELVVGYSLGARVALGLVDADLVARAVLIGVNPGIADAERAPRRAADAAWAALLRARGMAGFVDAWQAQPLFASQARVPATARRDRRLALDPEQLARSLEVMGLAEMPDYRGRLARRATRLALITGADDARFTAIARATSLPHEVIPDCGHDPTLEQPAALAAALARSIR